jgi:hypothetical protein
MIQIHIFLIRQYLYELYVIIAPIIKVLFTVLSWENRAVKNYYCF